MASYYPVFLNITGKRCLVIGGGEVALRKVRALLEQGAKVQVISPDVAPGLDRLAASGEIALVRRDYQNGDLAGALLVISATDNRETNLAVSREARAAGALVNVVDDPGSSDFIVPSCLRRGDLTIAVSTSGRSPALARKIRMRLEREYGEEYSALAVLVDEVRAETRRRGARLDGEDWQKALDLDLIVDLISKGEKEKARGILLANLERLKK